MESNGLGKLLPKAIAAKRRRRKQGSMAETAGSNDEAGTGVGDGAGQGPTAGSRGPTRGHSPVISRQQTADSSENTMAQQDEEDISLISYESEDPET